MILPRSENEEEDGPLEERIVDDVVDHLQEVRK
jgi:chromatin segregation and condensation protein Rec8/ScpA/Scc1 (kleisin family)